MEVLLVDSSRLLLGTLVSWNRRRQVISLTYAMLSGPFPRQADRFLEIRSSLRFLPLFHPLPLLPLLLLRIALLLIGLGASVLLHCWLGCDPVEFTVAGLAAAA